MRYVKYTYERMVNVMEFQPICCGEKTTLSKEYWKSDIEVFIFECHKCHNVISVEEEVWDKDNDSDGDMRDIISITVKNTSS